MITRMLLGLCRKVIVLFALGALLTACSSGGSARLPHLYNGGNDALAKSAKEKYDKAELTTALTKESENLDKLLASEVAAVRASYDAELDAQFFRMAANQRYSLADDFIKASAALQRMGFSSAARARDRFLDQQEANTLSGELEEVYERFAPDIRSKVPKCDTGDDMPEDFDFGNVSAGQQRRLDLAYKDLRETCENWRRLAAGQSLNELQDVQVAYLKKKADLAGVKVDEKAVRKAMATRRGERAKRDGEDGKDDKKVLPMDLIKEAPEVIAEANDFLGLGLKDETEKKIEAASGLIQAFAAGKFGDDCGDDGEQACLSEDDLAAFGIDKDVATSLQAVGKNWDAFMKASKQAVLADLLVELGQLKIKQDDAKKRLAIAARRVDFVRSKLEARQNEIAAWISFRDHLCNFAYYSKGRFKDANDTVPPAEHPGIKCDSFTVSSTPQTEAKTCQQDGVAWGECALTLPWRDALASGAEGFPKMKKGTKAPEGFSDQDIMDQKRELYLAISAFARVYEMKAQQAEIGYRMIDLNHRESLLSDDFALKSWDNLVAGGMTQLAGYHAEGLKPEAIADLILKATIAAGVTLND